VRVTARGYGVLAAGAALLVAGFVFGYPELAALGSACVVALVSALIFVSWRPQLSVVRTVDPDRVMRGESSRVTLHISNASRFFGASVVARDRCGGRLVPVPLVRLRPGRVTTVSYLVPTTRRGVVPVGPLEITRRDPLGLVGVVRRYGDFAQVWVRPRVHTIAAVPVGLSRSMDGRIDRVPHGSITFAALREYVVGDDLRSVHWRTSARVGELMVREHVDTSLPRVIVLLDARTRAHLLESGAPARDSGGEPTFEAACEAAASVLVAAVREDVHVTLHLVTGDGPAGATAVSSHAEVGQLLDALAEAELSGPTADDEQTRDPLRATIEQLRARRLGDTLLYLTGPPHQTDLGLVAGLRGAYPSIIASVFGPVESGLGTTAGMLVVGATDGADFAAAWDGIRAW
jgi:uncharacterized protein (DUF58 family)